MQIHQGRCNVIKALQAYDRRLVRHFRRVTKLNIHSFIHSSQKSNEQQNSTQTVAAGQETKANEQEQYYSNPRHAPTEALIQQTRPSLIDGSYGDGCCVVSCNLRNHHPHSGDSGISVSSPYRDWTRTGTKTRLQFILQ